MPSSPNPPVTVSAGGTPPTEIFVPDIKNIINKYVTGCPEI
jgi:hypothetical protein